MKKGVYGIVLKNKNILVVRNSKKDYWIMPGGALDNESETECLTREFLEELSGTKIDIAEKYGEFLGNTPNSKKPILAKFYFCSLTSKLGNPSSEIAERKYVSEYKIETMEFSDTVKKCIDSLIFEGYL